MLNPPVTARRARTCWNVARGGAAGSELPRTSRSAPLSSRTMRTRELISGLSRNGRCSEGRAAEPALLTVPGGKSAYAEPVLWRNAADGSGRRSWRLPETCRGSSPARLGRACFPARRNRCLKTRPVIGKSPPPPLLAGALGATRAASFNILCSRRSSSQRARRSFRQSGDRVRVPTSCSSVDVATAGFRSRSVAPKASAKRRKWIESARRAEDNARDGRPSLRQCIRLARAQPAMTFSAIRRSAARARTAQAGRTARLCASNAVAAAAKLLSGSAWRCDAGE